MRHNSHNLCPCVRINVFANDVSDSCKHNQEITKKREQLEFSRRAFVLKTIQLIGVRLPVTSESTTEMMPFSTVIFPFSFRSHTSDLSAKTSKSEVREFVIYKKT